MDYIDVNSLLTDNQHGFRKDHSCIHSVAQLTNFIDTKMNTRTPTLAVFVDFWKAFDCVQHPILIEKLSRLGLNAKVVEWFKSYLRDRKQQVLANNVRSTFQTITQGVPQGSVLGPLFYILYANDIVKVIKYCKIALYADDTVLYTANSNFETSISKVRKDVQALSGWCGANGIGMNTDKTKPMVFGNAKKLAELPEVNIELEDVQLVTVSSYKYLGITLDGQLNYARHINKLISSVSLKLKQFRRMRSFLSTKAATLAYKNLILPIIEYGDIFLTGATNGNKKKVQILQNKGIRCALKADRDTSTRELHTEMRMLRLKHKRETHILNFMYDQSKKVENLRMVKGTGVKTRSSKKKLLRIKKPNTEKFKRSLTYLGPKIWNALPSDLQSIQSKNEFKTKILNHVAARALIAD